MSVGQMAFDQKTSYLPDASMATKKTFHALVEQKDINDGRIVYFHDGDAKTADDFYFRVSDGKFQPIYRHFRIHIIPLEVKLVSIS
jgi:hypothetical protein